MSAGSFFGGMIGMSGATGVMAVASDGARQYNNMRNNKVETESSILNATMASQAKVDQSNSDAANAAAAGDVQGGAKGAEFYANAL